MSVTNSSNPLLYQTTLGDIATVSVTHTAGCLDSPYAGNLGLHVHDDQVDVLASRQRLERTLGKPIQWLNQVHSTTVWHTQDTFAASSTVPTADAAVTHLNSVALAVMTADCLPVVITAQNASGAKAVGISHAGWRGLLNGVIQQTITQLLTCVPHAELHAHLGPCIGVAQFEVGAEVRAVFITKSAESERHFYEKPNGKFCCDLEGLAREVLLSQGAISTSGGGWCTHSDPRLASYRRQALTGRFATLVALS